MSLFRCFAVVLAVSFSSAHALDAGYWQVRFGASHAAPDASSSAVTLNGDTLLLAEQRTTLDVDSNTQLGLTLEYGINNSWAVELLASTPFSHTATARGPLNGLDIVDVKHLPPTLSAIYRFTNGAAFTPYVGAGLNYTLFFDEEVTGTAANTFATLGLENGKVELDNSLGLALQVGGDFVLNDSWSINASVRWIDINTTANIRFAGGNVIRSDIEIDPYVYSVLLGYQF